MTHKYPVQGYFMGAWMYLGIVFTLPLGLGVYALALDLPVNTTEALQGLVMPASAYVLLGKGGDSLVIPKSTCDQLARVKAIVRAGAMSELTTERPRWCLTCVGHTFVRVIYHMCQRLTCPSILSGHG